MRIRSVAICSGRSDPMDSVSGAKVDWFGCARERRDGGRADDRIKEGKRIINSMRSRKSRGDAGKNEEPRGRQVVPVT